MWHHDTPHTITRPSLLKITHLLILRNLNLDVTNILRLEELDDIGRQRLVPAVADGNAIIGPPLDHAPVELILIPERGLLAQSLDPALLALVVARTMDVVLVLFEQTKLLAVEGLRALLVVAPRHEV
jgi:hypothetical protein